LRQVPEARWPEVLHFVESIRDPEPTIHTAAEMASSGLVGLWADRDDLGPTAEFAAHLRREAETRRGADDAPGH
jgi:hypothetical protein